MGDEFFMDLAIKEAWKFQLLTYPNPAVGCVIVDKNGRILSIAAHEKCGSAHAELNAVILALCEISPKFYAKFLDFFSQNLPLENFTQNGKTANGKSAQNFKISTKILTKISANLLYDFALANHNKSLFGASVFVTLEPCSHFGKTPPCADLLANLGVKRVIIGSNEHNQTAKGGCEILAKNGVKITANVLKERTDELLEPFLAWSAGHFSFFKIALSQNGVASGGVISGDFSHIHTHKIRALIDLLMIGGKSVREDRPILDARLIGGKNPDVMIFSKQRDFDRKIPLFGVPEREVFISDDFSEILARRFVMIEGGGTALARLDKRVRWLLIYRSNDFFDRENIKLRRKIKILHTTFLEGENLGDELIWAKILE